VAWLKDDEWQVNSRGNVNPNTRLFFNYLPSK
jgi:hypothetical protein